MKLAIEVAIFALVAASSAEAAWRTEPGVCVAIYGAMDAAQALEKSSGKAVLAGYVPDFARIDYAARKKRLLDQGDARLRAGLTEGGLKIAVLQRQYATQLLVTRMSGQVDKRDALRVRHRAALRRRERLHPAFVG